jgi:FkbM family methyltransferase
LRDGLEINPAGLSEFLHLSHLFRNSWRIKWLDERYLLLCHSSGLAIKCRQATGADVRHLAELFVYREHGSDFKGKTVIDIGMSNGDSAIFFAENGASKVVGLEPFAESFYLAAENVEINHLQAKIMPVHAALASSRGETELIASSQSPHLASTSGGQQDSQESAMKSRIATLDLKDVIEMVGEPSVDYLKMDCEGCEHETIRLAPTATLRIFKEISMEVHGDYADVLQRLASCGFIVNVRAKWEDTWRLRAHRKNNES